MERKGKGRGEEREGGVVRREVGRMIPGEID